MWMWIPYHCYKLGPKGIIFAILLANSVYAQRSYGSLEIAYHIRTLSMSGTGVADGRGMDITAMNPALLQSNPQTLLLSVIRYPADIQSEVVEWRLPVGNRMGAVSLRHVGFGTFDRRSIDNVKTGQFGAGDTWISVSVAQEIFSSLDVGLTMGMFYSQVDNVSATLGLITAGTILRLDTFGAKLGLSVKNMGITLNSYTEYKEPIPATINIGVLKSLVHLPLDLSIEGTWWRGMENGIVRLGGEFTLPYNFTLRWGTSSRRFDLGTNILWETYLAGTSFGFGYTADNLTVDLGLGYNGAGGTIIGIGFSTIL